MQTVWVGARQQKWGSQHPAAPKCTSPLRSDAFYNFLPSEMKPHTCV